MVNFLKMDLTHCLAIFSVYNLLMCFYQSPSLMSAKLSRGSSMWGNIVILIRFSYQKYGITS